MGGSHWSDDFHNDREEERRRAGTSAFAYDAKLKKDPATKRVVHAKMNPHGKTRESRDPQRTRTRSLSASSST